MRWELKSRHRGHFGGVMPPGTVGYDGQRDQSEELKLFKEEQMGRTSFRARWEDVARVSQACVLRYKPESLVDNHRQNQ